MQKRKSPLLTTRDRLAIPAELDAFCDAIAANGSIAGACRELGYAERRIWEAARTDKALDTALMGARAATADRYVDEAIAIADKATPGTAQVAKLRIDTRLRVAGKLNQGRYGDHAGNVTNIQNNVGIICGEEERARLVALREKLTAQVAAQSRALPAVVVDEPEEATP